LGDAGKDRIAMSESATAHGMDGRLVEPDWAVLTVDEVQVLLSQFEGLGEAVRILSVSPRPFSAASVVETDGGRVFIKRHHCAVRDGEGLLEEHRFMAHLLAHGAKVPRVLATEDDETAIEIEEWTYEAHAVPEGVDLYGDALSWTPFRSGAHARSAGRALAQLHCAAQGFDAPNRKPRSLVASFTIFAARDAEMEMDRYLDARPLLAADGLTLKCCGEALELLRPYHAELLPLLPSLPALWTHNDLHASNLFWSDSGSDARATATIDFGLADRTNSVHDLAHAIERNIVEWLALVQNPERPEDVPVHLGHLNELLEGYETVRPLSDAEAAALAPMTALCHAEFALSEADYFLGVLHSQEKAAMACDGWLVGHARWFRGAGGKKLLHAIRQWANVRKGTARGNQ
jgi:Ser/Thr protein kinase RdoA (MazF antagonist)